LNSNDAFFVVEKGGANAWAWIGEGSSDEESAYAKALGPILQPDAAFAAIKEGEEPEEFWTALGGKTEYPNTKTLGFSANFSPRLFQVSNASGYIWMRPIDNFLQEDLCNHDVMVLDCFQHVYIWEGRQANNTEKKQAVKKV
jgi:hypothetical protein